MHNHQRGWRVALAVYLVFIGIILWIAYQGLVPAAVARVPYYDKLGHALLSGALGLLMHRAMGHRSLPLRRLALPAGFALATGLILLEELVQFWSPFRNSSPIDFAADLFGLGAWWIVDQSIALRSDAKMEA